MTISSESRATPARDLITEPARRAMYERAGWWTPDTLDARVRAHAARRPDAVAVVDLDGDRRMTWAHLDADGDRIAALLVDRGARPGDVIAVQLPNWYETVAIDLGVLRMGGILNPMLPLYRGNELRHMLALPRTRILFTPQEYNGVDHRTIVADLRNDVPDLVHHISVPTPAPGGSAYLGTLPAPTTRTWADRDAAAVSELMYTSGTEAQPKAIMHTEQTTNFAARDTAAELGLDDGDVVWMPSPLGHSTGLNYGLRVALYHGLTLVLQDRWDPEVAVRQVARERCSYTVAATTFLSDLVKQARATGTDVSCLRLAASGGAPIPAALVDAAADVGVGVLRIYGSTELLAATWNRPTSPREKRVGTDGHASPAIEVEVRRDDGTPVVGEPGEIFARGPQVCVGFYADPERTASTFGPEGWVRSGDLGVLDEDGYVRVVGRKKEIIIRGGLNIAPRELEDVIGRMPNVRQVAVIGLPDERLGEITCACVVPSGPVTLPDITAHLEAVGLARFKWPQRLVTLESLPMTETGKVKKFELVRAHAAPGQSQEG